MSSQNGPVLIAQSGEPWLVIGSGRCCLDTNHSDGLGRTETGITGQLALAELRKGCSQSYRNKPDKGLNWDSNQVYAMNLTKKQKQKQKTTLCAHFSLMDLIL